MDYSEARDAFLRVVAADHRRNCKILNCYNCELARVVMLGPQAA